MNIEKRNEEINASSELIASRARIELDSIYMKGFHDGRHEYRDKIKKYLIINPNIKHQVMEMAQDPCPSCSDINDLMNFKKACLCSRDCYKKQNQLLALDLLKHFEL